MRAVNIEWCYDEEHDKELIHLPTEVEIPLDVDEYEITDYLSDTYGFLVEGYSIDRGMIQRIELCLEDWTEHYPTGCIIHYYDGREISDFCDTVPEYKEFLDQHMDEIRRSSPRIFAKIDLSDLDMSNVMVAVRELDEYIHDEMSK